MWGKSPFAGLGSAVAAAAKQYKATSAGIAVFNGEMSKGGRPRKASPKGLASARTSRRGSSTAPRRRASPAPSCSSPPPPPLRPPRSCSPAPPEGGAAASGVLLARYLVEAPPNVCTPRHLARAAESVAAAAPDVFSVEIFGQKACEEMSMGAFLGVSACSALEPQLIHLTYTPPGFEEGEGRVKQGRRAGRERPDL